VPGPGRHRAAWQGRVIQPKVESHSIGCRTIPPPKDDVTYESRVQANKPKLFLNSIALRGARLFFQPKVEPEAGSLLYRPARSRHVVREVHGHNLREDQGQEGIGQEKRQQGLSGNDLRESRKPERCRVYVARR
jgi:hypothetical protein